MSQDFISRKSSIVHRTSSISSAVLRPQAESINNTSRITSTTDIQRSLSNRSQTYLPNENEYHPQERVPPTGPEVQQPYRITDDDQSIDGQSTISLVNPIYGSTDEDIHERNKGQKLSEKTRRILFFVEPIMGAFILFPIIVLFWESGWNFNLILLNLLNSNYSLDYYVRDDPPLGFPTYTWQSLISPYLIVQFLLLFYYLGQNSIYSFLKKQNRILKGLLLRFNIFLLATIYITQWVMLWTIWEVFSTHKLEFELTLSLTALFAFIVFNGHLSDLICSPFLLSFDSIEYCIHFGCPLVTKEMKQWKINLINYILYEKIIISNLSVICWRGFYNFINTDSFPHSITLPAEICLIIGYVLYFPLMYCQTYLEELNLKYEFWTFVSINFPQFYRNIRHLLAFFSCIFSWRGYWKLYDDHIKIFEDYYKTYLLIYMVSFLILTIFQTSSSVNGPLSHLNDKNNFFPLYPHCYVSIVQRKFSQRFSSKRKSSENNDAL